MGSFFFPNRCPQNAESGHGASQRAEHATTDSVSAFRRIGPGYRRFPVPRGPATDSNDRVSLDTDRCIRPSRKRPNHSVRGMCLQQTWCCTICLRLRYRNRPECTTAAGVVGPRGSATCGPRPEPAAPSLLLNSGPDGAGVRSCGETGTHWNVRCCATLHAERHRSSFPSIQTPMRFPNFPLPRPEVSNTTRPIKSLATLWYLVARTRLRNYTTMWPLVPLPPV